MLKVKPKKEPSPFARWCSMVRALLPACNQGITKEWKPMMPGMYCMWCEGTDALQAAVWIGALYKQLLLKLNGKEKLVSDNHSSFIYRPEDSKFLLGLTRQLRSHVMIPIRELVTDNRTIPTDVLEEQEDQWRAKLSEMITIEAINWVNESFRDYDPSGGSIQVGVAAENGSMIVCIEYPTLKKGK